MNANEQIDYLQSIHKTKKQYAQKELKTCENNLGNLQMSLSFANLKLKVAKENLKSPFVLSGALGAAGIGVCFVVLPLGIISLAGSMTALGLGMYEKQQIKQLEKFIEQVKNHEIKSVEINEKQQNTWDPSTMYSCPMPIASYRFSMIHSPGTRGGRGGKGNTHFAHAKQGGDHMDFPSILG